MKLGGEIGVEIAGEKGLSAERLSEAPAGFWRERQVQVDPNPGDGEATEVGERQSGRSGVWLLGWKMDPRSLIIGGSRRFLFAAEGTC